MAYPRSHQASILQAIAVLALLCVGLADVALAAVDGVVVTESDQLNVTVTVQASQAPTFQVFSIPGQRNQFAVELPGQKLDSVPFEQNAMGVLLLDAHVENKKTKAPSRVVLSFADDVDFDAHTENGNLVVTFAHTGDAATLFAMARARQQEATRLAEQAQAQRQKAAEAEAARALAVVQQQQQRDEQLRREQEQARLMAERVAQQAAAAEAQRREALAQKQRELEAQKLAVRLAREAKIKAEAEAKAARVAQAALRAAQAQAEKDAKNAARAEQARQDEMRLAEQRAQAAAAKEAQRQAEQARVLLAQAAAPPTAVAPPSLTPQPAAAPTSTTTTPPMVASSDNVAARTSPVLLASAAPDTALPEVRAERASATAGASLAHERVQPDRIERERVERERIERERIEHQRVERERVERERVERERIERERIERERVERERIERQRAERESGERERVRLEAERAQKSAQRQAQLLAMERAANARRIAEQQALRSMREIHTPLPDRFGPVRDAQVLVAPDAGFGGRSVDLLRPVRYECYVPPPEDENAFGGEDEGDIDERLGRHVLDFITVQRMGDTSRIGVRVDGGAQYNVERRGREVMLTLFDTRAKNLDVRRGIDAHALGGVALRVLPTVEEDARFRIALRIELARAAPVRLSQADGMLWLTLDAPASTTQVPAR